MICQLTDTPVVTAVRVVWEDDPHWDRPDHLRVTPEEHYGEAGANWKHVTGEYLAKVIADHGSVWGACVEYARQDAARLAAWEAGEWCETGCFAVAKVRSPSGVVQTIRSGGLWGIESDAGEEYRREVEQDSLDDLRRELEAFGVALDGFAELAAR